MQERTGSTPPRLVGLTVGDEPGAWRAAGFHVADGRVTTGGVTCHLAGTAAGRGVLGWQLEPAAPGPLDGLAPTEAWPTRPDQVGDGATTATAAAHPNGSVALDHVVVATDDLERTTSALATVGLVPRRTVVGAQGDDRVAFRFFLLGTCVLEVIGATSTAATSAGLGAGGGAAAPGTTRAADGSAAFVGLAFTTDRIDDLGDLAPAPRAAVQPGRRITTLDHRALDISVPLALLSPRPGRGG
jgi:hypothetical protein